MKVVKKFVIYDIENQKYFKRNCWADNSIIHAQEFNTRHDALNFISTQHKSVFKIESIYINE